MHSGDEPNEHPFFNPHQNHQQPPHNYLYQHNAPSLPPQYPPPQFQFPDPAFAQYPGQPGFHSLPPQHHHHQQPHHLHHPQPPLPPPVHSPPRHSQGLAPLAHQDPLHLSSSHHPHLQTHFGQPQPSPPQSPFAAPRPLKLKLKVPLHLQHSPVKPESHHHHQHQHQIQAQMAASPSSPPIRQTRRMTRQQGGTRSSGSEYSIKDHHSSPSEGEPEEEVVTLTRSRRGRLRKQVVYDEGDTEDFDEDLDDAPPSRSRSRVARGRPTQDPDGFIATDDDEEKVTAGYNTRTRSRRLKESNAPPPPRPQGRLTRNSSGRDLMPPLSPHRKRVRNAREQLDEELYEDDEDAEGEDVDASFENEEEVPHTTPEPEDDAGLGTGPRTYALRKRTKEVNYTIPPPLEDIPQGPSKKGGKKKNMERGLRWGASGADLSRAMGLSLPGQDSDSDAPMGRTPRKLIPGGGGMFAPGAGLMPVDLAGTPSNLGKVGDAALADADPLGVNTNVTFDEVGGLDDHIMALKEMTLLPLLYPELFQQFNVTPPRGVLFHGPPGTGKTLVARALAASCRSGGRSISFFMRKGADCLSKWVGEAERQLRLLFEEARACQPSIIFFDEIDGLAPVRSSKQDQIHASIVSTLLALMDGMDGRGQVIVIGATNRPDAIDPALRRPGRFDREFYFPLPNLTARTRILEIMTKGWDGWHGDDGKEAREGLGKATKGFGGADLRALCTEASLIAIQRRYPQIYRSSDRLLVDPTSIKVQARDFMVAVKKLTPSSARSTSSVAMPMPPQLAPLLDDALSRVKRALGKVMALSTAPAGSGTGNEEGALVIVKKRSPLEEAEWEWDEEGGEKAALQREMLLQSMETLRVNRPRVLISGPPGMGQGYVAAAVLHHLEGYHVQTLDLGSLLGDSTRTPEASIIQLFIEAKRNKPSVIYIPALLGWCSAVTETTRATVRSMLESLAPTDAILLLAVLEGGSFASLPRDVRAWFGTSRETRVSLSSSTSSERQAFFRELMEYVEKKPTEFPDAVKKRRRVLEELPIAPPLPPRKPTEGELKLQADNDLRTKALLKYRLGPILTELKKKFKRFAKTAAEEYGVDEETGEIGDFRRYRRSERVAPAPLLAIVDVEMEQALPRTPPPIHINGVVNGEGDADADGSPIVPYDSEPTNQTVNGITHEADEAVQTSEQPVAPPETTIVPSTPSPPPQSAVLADTAPVSAPTPAPPAPPESTRPKMHDVDLEKMQANLYYDCYLTPGEFLGDVGKMVFNAEQMYHDSERLFRAQAMYNAAQISILELDPQFRVDCERMAVRERERFDVAKRAREKETVDDGGNASGAATAANGTGYAPGTRRSARANGLKPELAFTDPLKLERKLKRQRSDGAADSSAGANGSGGEADMMEGGRSPKRARIEIDGEGGDDPFAMPTAKLTVRFASPSSDGQTKTTSDGMDVDQATLSENARVAADWTLPPPPEHSEALTLGSDNIREESPIASSSMGTGQPLIVPPDGTLQVPPASDLPLSSIPSSLVPLLNPDGPNDRPTLPLPSRERTRSPTPTPPPPFHASSDLLSGVRAALVDGTHPLNVEQLEQLRAAALDTVWRYRADWDRDPMMRELLRLAKEFVEEVECDIRDNAEEDVAPAGAGAAWGR